MKISAVFIVKNEEKELRAALESVKDFDEIVLVDTGSTDKTLEIAQEFTDNIYHFEWCDDFAKARNFANSKATGDWIYSIDADHKLLSTYETVKAEAEEADKLGHKSALVRSVAGKHEHWREVLFKNDPEVFWVGAVHEYISKPSAYRTKVERACGYSENHGKDPDRNLRILEASEKNTRTHFYLGREYYDHKRYDEAIEAMTEYLKTGKWIPEKGEAYLVIALCHWYSNRGDFARKACLKAITINPDFKEALKLMAKMHYSPWKEKWERLASVATNTDVLFIRS